MRLPAFWRRSRRSSRPTIGCEFLLWACICTAQRERWPQSPTIYPGCWPETWPSGCRKPGTSFCWSCKSVVEEIITHSAEETTRWGRELAKHLRPPVLVLLSGELGTGKTTLAKGIVAGLGAAGEDEVTSPTFT